MSYSRAQIYLGGIRPYIEREIEQCQRFAVNRQGLNHPTHATLLQYTLDKWNSQRTEVKCTT